MISITLIPAHGRDYASKNAALADFDAGKDFLLNDWGSPFDGKPVNKPQLAEEGTVRSVKIRYRRLAMICRADVHKVNAKPVKPRAADSAAKTAGRVKVPSATVLARRAENQDGLCLACGRWTSGGVEPDARNYPCERCGANRVYGAEELLIRTTF